MLAAAETEDSIAVPVIVFLALGAGIIYTFGYLRAVMHRANTDYKKTKAGLPAMRKAFWLSWWAAVKWGFWIAIGIVVLGFWAYGDIVEKQPQPAATTVPATTSKGPGK